MKWESAIFNEIEVSQPVTLLLLKTTLARSCFVHFLMRLITL